MKNTEAQTGLRIVCRENAKLCLNEELLVEKMQSLDEDLLFEENNLSDRLGESVQENLFHLIPELEANCTKIFALHIPTVPRLLLSLLQDL